MKTLKTQAAHLSRPRAVGAVLLLTAAAALSACAASHHFTANAPAPSATQAAEELTAEPLPGSGTAMRLDTQRGRVQFFDGRAALSGIVPATARDCHGDVAALEPGLWLAVAETRVDGQRELVLQPLGTTAPARLGGVAVQACDAPALAGAVVLPQGLRARMLARGGVLFVDGDGAQNARELAFARKGP